MSSRGFVFAACVVVGCTLSWRVSAQTEQPGAAAPDAPLEEAQPAPSLDEVPPEPPPAEEPAADEPATEPTAAPDAPLEEAQPASPAPAGAWRGDREPPRWRFDREPSGETLWYGWQTLTADLLSAGVMIGGGALESEVLAVSGVLGLLLATPVTHLMHDQGGSAALSVSVRVGLGLAFVGGLALCLSSIFDSRSTSEEVGCGLALGAALGVPAMAIVDATVLAYEDAPKPRPLRRVGSGRLGPFVDVQRGTAGLSYRGAF